MEFPDGLPQLSNYGGLPSGAGGTPVTLAQFSPPEFYRPHFQDGYLAGEYPIVHSYTHDHDTGFKQYFDFNWRLVAKILIPDVTDFKASGFNPVDGSMLRPVDDGFLDTANNLKETISASDKRLRIMLETRRTTPDT